MLLPGLGGRCVKVLVCWCVIGCDRVGFVCVAKCPSGIRDYLRSLSVALRMFFSRVVSARVE